jgi:competence protein ComEC
MFQSLKEKKEGMHEAFHEYGKILACICLVVISISFIFIITRIASPQKLRVSFLDIGQGDAILIQTPSGKDMLIDGGPGNTILTRLNEQMNYFDSDIDVMEETHPDADHVTGLIPVLEKYKVGMILETKGIGHTQVFDDLNHHIDDESAETHVAQKGDVIDFHDGVLVKVLYPGVNYLPKKDDTNDASISVVVTYGDQSFLLTGDLPTTEESKLIFADLPKNITVYKAGHHGSKYSSGEQLLTYIRPEYSVVSAGKDNRYGHPNPEAIARLEKYSKEILSTIDRGTITFTTDGKNIEVETER